MTPTPRHGRPNTRPETPVFEVGLRLLDRQLVGSRDELLGNADNAVLEPVNDRLAVTALVSGPAGLAPRFGGRLQTWIEAIWRRLRPEADPQPIVIPMAHVVEIGSAISLDQAAQQLVADGAQLERWLRRYLIDQIPGATGGPDRLAGERLHTSAPTTRQPSAPHQTSSHLASDLIGASVHTSDGAHLGTVLDLYADPPQPGWHHIGPIPLRSLLVGRRRFGSQLGFGTSSNRAPWIVGRPLRAWHHDDRVIDIDDVDIDWPSRRVTLAKGPVT